MNTADVGGADYLPPSDSLDFGLVGAKLQEAVLKVVVDGLLQMKDMRHVEFVDWVSYLFLCIFEYIQRSRRCNYFRIRRF